jgi:hypothetical protein
MNRLVLCLAFALMGCTASADSAPDGSWAAAPLKCPTGQGQCREASEVTESAVLAIVKDAGPSSPIDGAAGATSSP